MTIAVARPAFAGDPPDVEVIIEETLTATEDVSTSGAVVNESISATDGLGGLKDAYIGTMSESAPTPPTHTAGEATQKQRERPTISPREEDRKSGQASREQKSRDTFSRATGAIKESGEGSDGGSLSEAGNAGSTWMVVVYVVIGLVAVALLGLFGRRLLRVRRAS